MTIFTHFTTLQRQQMSRVSSFRRYRAVDGASCAANELIVVSLRLLSLSSARTDTETLPRGFFCPAPTPISTFVAAYCLAAIRAVRTASEATLPLPA